MLDIQNSEIEAKKEKILTPMQQKNLSLSLKTEMNSNLITLNLLLTLRVQFRIFKISREESFTLTSLGQKETKSM